jgi:hypothetical protein
MRYIHLCLVYILYNARIKLTDFENYKDLNTTHYNILGTHK